MVATDVFGTKKKKSIKAKLGKKASQSANLTDTSFRAAKLHVSEQRVIESTTAASKNVALFRRPWPEIAAQLVHPNPSVRLAGLKSLAKSYEDDEGEDDDDVWKTIALTTTDEDASVRELGRLRLLERLSRRKQQARKQQPHQDSKKWDHLLSASLVEYLLAVTSTALNGLEDALCQDGAKNVLLLAQHGIMMEDVAMTKVLPSLTRLLNDTIARKGSMPSKKRQKTRDSSPKLLVLQAIHAMLETLMEDGSVHHINSSKTHRGVDRRQRLAERSSEFSGPQSYNNLIAALWQSQSMSKPGTSNHDDKYDEIALDLLSKLRQCLADDSLLVISAKIIRLMLLHKYLKNLSIDDHNPMVHERLAKVAIKITQSLMEHFDEDHADDLCETLFCLSQLTPEDDNNQAIAFVTDHIQTSLENDMAMPHTAPSTSATMLEILGDVLASSQTSSYLSRESIVSIVDLFVTVFFGENTNYTSTCCSATGRKAVEIGGYLLTNSMNHFGDEDVNTSMKGGALQTSEAQFGMAVRDIMLGIPKYVDQWGGDNVDDTIRAMAVLRDVARRCRKENEGCRMDQLLLSRLRSSMEQAWFSPGKIQRHIVSLVAIVESPTEITIQSLGTICGRLRFLKLGRDGANPVASFIVNCIHNIRRTVPMQQYIRFLMDGSGSFAVPEILNAADRERKTMEFMEALDHGLQDSSACLVQCGSAKVLPMLEQLLLAFLQKTKLEDGDFSKAVQSRAAVAILAVTSLDATKYGKSSSPVTSVFDVFPNHFQKLTVDSILFLLLYRSRDESITRDYWIRPIISLLATEELLFKILMDSIVFASSSSQSKRQTQMLELWLELFESPKLSKLVKLSESSMISSVKCGVHVE